MKFKEEIKKVQDFFSEYSVMLCKKGGYFFGVKRLIDFSSELILVQAGKQLVLVKGKNLRLQKMIEGDLAFKGEVEEVTVKQV